MSADTDVAIDRRLYVEVSRDAGASSFDVVLIDRTLRYYTDDPTPDITKTTVAETVITVSWPGLFAAVDTWLHDEFRLRVLPHSWSAGSSGGTTGIELLLEGHVLPADADRRRGPVRAAAGDRKSA